MRLREKIGYIIEYYGFLVVALVLMIVVGITLISGLFSEEKDSGMSIAAVNQYYSEDEMRVWESAFRRAYGDLPVEFDPSYQVDVDGFSDDTKQGYLMKLSANLFAGEIDMMILDEKSYEHFLTLGALRDLRPLISEVSSHEETDEALKKSLLEAGEENTEKIFGLVLPENFNMKSGEKTYLVIPESGNAEYQYLELFRAIYTF